jgi:N-acetylmuramoyl-L-alanine amidase
VLAALVLAACSSGNGTVTTVPRAQPTTTASTTTTSPPPPLTEPPPQPTTTTTTAATLSRSNAKAVVSPRGVVLPVLGREGGGLLVGTPCGNSTVVTRGIPIEGATVVLDPGHGGDEPGAVGPNGLSEKELNLAVSGHARDALEAAGVSVALTRTGDYRMTLEARAQLVEALDPRAFVSVHHNAEPDGPRDGPGSETYYQVASPESKRLAGLIYEEVVRALSRYAVAWVADTDAGAKYRRNSLGDDYYGILRRTQGTPAVLAELAFVSNPPEAELLARPDVQKVAGEAVARGVVRFLTTRDPGSGFTEPYPRETPAGPGGGARGCRDPVL